LTEAAAAVGVPGRIEHLRPVMTGAHIVE
jgi:hypothetical protein